MKEQLYGIGFFGDLFGAFRQHLSQHKYLISCGYGFRDPGINSRLNQWLADRLDEPNQIVVLNEGPAVDFFADKPYWLQEYRLTGGLS